MTNTIYVTKSHYDYTARKITQMQSDLNTLRRNKKDAYENCGDGWHDNPFYIQLLHEERMSERRISETITAFSNYTVFDYTNVPKNPTSVSLGTRIKVAEEDLKRNTYKEYYMKIVPLGDEEKNDSFLYYTPRVKPLLGAQIGETRQVSIPSGSLSIEILSIAKDTSSDDNKH